MTDLQNGEQPGQPLSKTQRAVLALIGAGLLNKEIAHFRGCAESTVKNHVSMIMENLGVTNRTLAALAYHGITKDDLDRALDEGRRV